MRSAIFIVTLILFPAIAQADTIVQNTGTPGFPGTFNYIGYNSSNVAFGQPVATEFLSFGGRFHPGSGSNEQAFASGTIVTATQNGVSFTVPYSNAVPDPNLFQKSIAFSPNLLGSWQLTVSNPSTSPTYNSLVINTAAIPTLPVPSFITGATISGTSATVTTPTITWNAPAAVTLPNNYNQNTKVFIFDLNHNRQEIFRQDLTSGQTSVTIPANIPGFGALDPNGHYGVLIRDDFRLNSNATTGASSQSFFDFHPNAISQFSGPVQVPVSSVNTVGQTVYSCSRLHFFNWCRQSKLCNCTASRFRNVPSLWSLLMEWYIFRIRAGPCSQHIVQLWFKWHWQVRDIGN